MSEIKVETDVEQLNSLSEKLDNGLNQLQELLKQFRPILTELKQMKADVKKMEQQLKKSSKKTTQKTTRVSTTPNGFAIPIPISKDLSVFIKDNLVKVLETPIVDAENSSPKVLEKNELDRKKNKELLEHITQFKTKEDWENLIARTDVTRLLTKYVQHHKLQDKEQKKNILLTSAQGKKLHTLLNDVNEDLTFINMQKYIKHHFKSKNTKPVVVEATKTASATAAAPAPTASKKKLKLKKQYVPPSN
jgi:DNA-binding protein YbaB